MRNRHLVSSALATVVALGVVGAGASASTPEPPVPTPAPGAIVNSLGARLQPLVSASADDGNVVFSPFSIATAMSMASGGAAGDTLTEMRDVLGTDAGSHFSLATLGYDIDQESAGSVTSTNSVWVQSGLEIVADFEVLLTCTYRVGGVGRVDFAADPDGSRQAINDWVAEMTDDRIVDLLTAGDVDALTKMVLVNALLLDAEWVTPFDPELTEPRPFTTADGTTIDSDTMPRLATFGYSEFSGGQAITLPYTNGLEMVVVLPTGSVDEFVAALADADGDLDALVAGWSSREVDLTIPRFEVTTRSGLVDAFVQLGLSAPFDPDRADFSAMTADTELMIGNIVHEATITVDEAGTEAAASTAVVMAPTAAPAGDQPEPAVMHVDRPFFFAVRHQTSGAVLFQGSVANPAG